MAYHVKKCIEQEKINKYNKKYYKIENICYNRTHNIKGEKCMKEKIIKQTSNILICAFSGIIIAIIIWAILKIMNGGISLLWDWIPSNVNIPFYTIIVCTIGGLLLGLYRKKIGDYPEELEDVIEKVKKDKFYPYNNIFSICIAALIPLIFGASIGPEAGLTGVIVGLCYWAQNNMHYIKDKVSDIANIGISASLGIIFVTPLFGLVMPIEEKTDLNKEITIPKSSKILSIIIATLAAFLMFKLLNNLFGGELGMPHIDSAIITGKERIWGIGIALIGALFGYIYLIFEKISKYIFTNIKKKTNIVFSTVLGGLILGIIGTILPLTMFSGESQMSELAITYLNYSPWLLILIGFVKLLLTNICIKSEWRGGHFFPVIFSGVSIGYGISMITGLNPAFCLGVITAGILGIIMRKPAAVSLLLLLCFPVRVIPWVMIAAFIGSILPLGKLNKKENNLA